ncbi:MAG: HD domain-containing phosphohydrolase [Syntrophorhabdales bacterium]|jgi:putative two-component system response regulator
MATLYRDVEAAYGRTTESAFTDSLTGLYNHGFFLEVLSRELRRSQRTLIPFSLAIIDINSFGGYNERHGPVQGDRTLREAARIIARGIRDSDVLARYHGDAFIVLLADTDIAGAEMVLRRVKSHLDGHFGESLTVCIGCVSSKNATDRRDLLRRAGDAVTAGKIRNRNGIYLADADESPVDTKRSRLLVVDDQPVNLKILGLMLKSAGYEAVTATNGEEALSVLDRTGVDLILLDAMMPVMDGFEACRRLKGSEATRMIPVVMVTALDDMDSRVRAIEAGVDDFINKPVNRLELVARIKSLIKTKKLNESLVSVENVLFSLAAAVEAKDRYTEGHIKRVATLAVDLGRTMNLSAEDIEALRVGGVLHDIGKIGIPDSVLNKTGPLDGEEWEILKTHPDTGCRVAAPLASILKGALEVIRHHHEKLDGSGYPDGIKGDQISVVARIMAVADIYDALATDRPYRKGLETEKILEVMTRDAREGRIDANVVAKLKSLIERKGAGADAAANLKSHIEREGAGG